MKPAALACLLVLAGFVAGCRDTAAGAADAPRWELRSRHLVCGLPLPTDDRRQVRDADGRVRPGVSVLVREGFVVGHDDLDKVPAWVSYRWTEDDYRASEAFRGEKPRFSEDDELPAYARGGTSFDYATSKLQRGHMARDADMDAYGDDSVQQASRMSNLAPQSGELNPQEWLDLENAHRTVVADPASGIRALWVIAGPVFDPKRPRRYVGDGIAVPTAFYKIVAWHDPAGRLTARAYLMPQDAHGRPADFLTSVDDVERRTGLDFFPKLPAGEQRRLERTRFKTMWK